eukprot:12563580-Alexandrium_andersonii.AAC.1
MAPAWAAAGCHPPRWRLGAGLRWDPLRALPLRCRVHRAASRAGIPRRADRRGRLAGRTGRE